MQAECDMEAARACSLPHGGLLLLRYLAPALPWAQLEARLASRPWQMCTASPWILGKHALALPLLPLLTHFLRSHTVGYHDPWMAAFPDLAASLTPRPAAYLGSQNHHLRRGTQSAQQRRGRGCGGC